MVKIILSSNTPMDFGSSSSSFVSTLVIYSSTIMEQSDRESVRIARRVLIERDTLLGL